MKTVSLNNCLKMINLTAPTKAKCFKANQYGKIYTLCMYEK